MTIEQNIIHFQPKPVEIVRQIAQIAAPLSPHEKFELIRLILADMETLAERSAQPAALRSAYGICADLSPAPSERDIAEMRKEVFHSTRSVENKRSTQSVEREC